MDVLRKFKVFCKTENDYVETWKLTTPTTCPNDYRHEIDHLQTQEIDKKFIESQNVQHVFLNSISYHNTNGYYMLEGIDYTIPAGPTLYINDLRLPIKQSVYGLKICSTHDHIGDSFSIILNPNTYIGVVLEAAVKDSRNVITNNTVYENVVPGFYIKIGNNEYLITNKLENGIEIYPQLQEDIVPLTPIFLNLYIVKNYKIQSDTTLDAGYGAMGSKPLPAGTILRLVYNNNGTTAKNFHINYEYSY